jgi:hypothetical protein
MEAVLDVSPDAASTADEWSPLRAVDLSRESHPTPNRMGPPKGCNAEVATGRRQSGDGAETRDQGGARTGTTAVYGSVCRRSEPF